MYRISVVVVLTAALGSFAEETSKTPLTLAVKQVLDSHEKEIVRARETYQKDVAKARAAYLAICLDLTDPLGSEDRGQWIRALAALEQYPQLLDVLFHKSPGPAGDKLRAAATAAGLKKP